MNQNLNKMKITIRKHRFLYLFILLGLTISMNSCNDDDDDGMESIDQTFLEKYYKTQWFQETEGNQTQYLTFESKSEIFIKSWSRDDRNFEECFEVEIIDFDNPEIIDISSDKLVFQTTWNDGEDTYTELFTLTISGDVLKVVYFDDETNETGTVFYEKSSENLENLPFCG